MTRVFGFKVVPVGDCFALLARNGMVVAVVYGGRFLASIALDLLRAGVTPSKGGFFPHETRARRWLGAWRWLDGA